MIFISQVMQGKGSLCGSTRATGVEHDASIKRFNCWTNRDWLVVASTWIILLRIGVSIRIAPVRVLQRWAPFVCAWLAIHAAKDKHYEPSHVGNKIEAIKPATFACVV